MQSVPYAICSDGNTVVSRSATIQNFKSYTPIQGSTVTVKFTHKYAPSSNQQMILTIGGVTGGCTAKGTPMKQGSVYDGMEVDFRWNGTSWNCNQDVVETTSDYSIMADGTSIYNRNSSDKRYIVKKFYWLNNQKDCLIEVPSISTGYFGKVTICGLFYGVTSKPCVAEIYITKPLNNIYVAQIGYNVSSQDDSTLKLNSVEYSANGLALHFNGTISYINVLFESFSQNDI